MYDAFCTANCNTPGFGTTKLPVYSPKMCGLHKVHIYVCARIQGMRLQDFSDTIVNSTTQKMMDVVRFSQKMLGIFLHWFFHLGFISAQ